MTRDLDPRAVAQRLARLAELYVPESVEEGRARLRADAFPAAVAARLEELRALDDLVRYLHAHVTPALLKR
jgi:hypothetical protein